MRPLIARTELLDVENERCLSMGRKLHFSVSDDREFVEVLTTTERRSLFGRRTQTLRVGRLGPVGSGMLKAAVIRDVAFRVRVVEVTPPHLRKANESGIMISVWGDEREIDIGAVGGGS
ncbi:MAG: hypothetical protein KGN33_02760 [Paracoccaceae bacterium]|nr:hypothetical protein [Paracoccaceae bacterium]